MPTNKRAVLRFTKREVKSLLRAISELTAATDEDEQLQYFDGKVGVQAILTAEEKLRSYYWEKFHAS